jgi:hypothetical protein
MLSPDVIQAIVGAFFGIIVVGLIVNIFWTDPNV